MESEEVEEIEKLCNKFCGQRNYIRRFNIYLKNCKQRLKLDQLPKEELQNIKRVVNCVDTYDSIVFYIQTCIKLGQMKEAMRFVNSQLSNETLTKEQKETILEWKKKIQETRKKYIAIKGLKAGKDLMQVVETSGLSIKEVLQLKEMVSPKKETNEDELKIK